MGKFCTPHTSETKWHHRDVCIRLSAGPVPNRHRAAQWNPTPVPKTFLAISSKERTWLHAVRANHEDWRADTANSRAISRVLVNRCRSISDELWCSSCASLLPRNNFIRALDKEWNLSWPWSDLLEWKRNRDSYPCIHANSQPMQNQGRPMLGALTHEIYGIQNTVSRHSEKPGPAKILDSGSKSDRIYATKSDGTRSSEWLHECLLVGSLSFFLQKKEYLLMWIHHSMIFLIKSLQAFWFQHKHLNCRRVVCSYIGLKWQFSSATLLGATGTTSSKLWTLLVFSKLPEPDCVKWSTRGKQGKALEISARTRVKSQVLPWVISLLHVAPRADRSQCQVTARGQDVYLSQTSILDQGINKMKSVVLQHGWIRHIRCIHRLESISTL